MLNHRRINEDFQKKPLKKILVVATMNAGKSTLINALIGHRVNAVKTTACTNKLCYTYNKPCDDGITIRYENGELHYRNNKTCITENSNFVETGLHFNSSLAGSNICLIDTPGVNNSENITHGEITRKAINDNNVNKYNLKVENSRQKKIREMKLAEIAELVEKGYKQREIGERLKEQTSAAKTIMCAQYHTSLVDALKSVGINHSYQYRKTLAQYNGIKGYRGTAEQNISLLSMLKAGDIRRILFLSTGALMSPSSLLQGENIFGIAPLIRLESIKGVRK